MKAVILAGGFGTRISEESFIKPKPMVEIGGKPILWHILKIYSFYGINQFIICCGYKGNMIKEYFANYYLFNSDVTFKLKENQIVVHNNTSEPWEITLVDTGENAMTGGRLKKIRGFIDNETFCMTYGDGVADINIAESIAFHKSQNCHATLTAVKQPGRFGAFVLSSQNTKVANFREKPEGNGNEGAMINGGFFVLEPEVFDLIEDDLTIWEREPMEALANSGNLAAFVHNGFWQAMDTLRDKNYLENLWKDNKAPWKIWK